MRVEKCLPARISLSLLKKRSDGKTAPFIRIFILAGGESSRMGKAKCRLKLGERTFLEIISQTARKVNLPVAVIDHDIIPKCGPVSGIISAFRKFPCDAGLFLSCDMPLVTHTLLRELHNAFKQQAIFTAEQGTVCFPFLLPSNALEPLEGMVEEGNCSLQYLGRKLNARLFELPIATKHQLENVNTPEDYARVQKLWEQQQEERKQIVLDIRRINVRRGTNHLIHDLDWKVKKGEHWVILGANGSGKTTLLTALLGYITPTSGDITVLGEDYGDSDWPVLRQKIGLVSSSLRQMMADSEPAWITVASGKYAVIDFWGRPKKADRKGALETLKCIECVHLADRPWAFLSQGERQRVLIGRALMAKPALLILDEPCAGLDPAAREHFLQFLDTMMKNSNSPSLVLVTHHVEEIMPGFSHGLLLKEGRKLKAGPVKEILRSGLLSKTFSTKVRVRHSGSRHFLEVQANPDVVI